MPRSSSSLGGTMKRTRSTGLTAAMDYLDEDGNLTSDGLWDYVWDADGARERGDGAPHRGVPAAGRRVRKAGALWAADEQNQLTSMTMKTGLPTGMIRKRLEPVDYGQPWDYKALTPDGRYEPFGNFHYGVVGRASGFSGRRLLREAGRTQVANDTREGNPLHPGNPGWQWNPFGGTAPYGDYQEDQFMIDQGVDAYNTDVEYVRIPCEE